MVESSQRHAPPSSFKKGTFVPDCSPEFRNGFALVARALWPRKTAAEIAYRAKVSERLAKYWLSGEREPSFDVCMVILEQMRPRRRV